MSRHFLKKIKKISFDNYDIILYIVDMTNIFKKIKNSFKSTKEVATKNVDYDYNAMWSDWCLRHFNCGEYKRVRFNDIEIAFVALEKTFALTSWKYDLYSATIKIQDDERLIDFSSYSPEELFEILYQAITRRRIRIKNIDRIYTFILNSLIMEFKLTNVINHRYAMNYTKGCDMDKVVFVDILEEINSFRTGTGMDYIKFIRITNKPSHEIKIPLNKKIDMEEIYNEFRKICKL